MLANDFHAGIFIVVIFTVALVSLVFNAFAIAFWNKSKDDFKKSKGLLVTAVVLNFVFVLLELIALVTLTRYIGFMIVSAIVSLLVLAANILAIISLCIENVPKIEKVKTPNVSVSNLPTFENKMKKLGQMRDCGQITKEEYDLLKKSFIEDEINGANNK